MHIYGWIQTALRGLVTAQDTLTQPLFHYIQAFKQKDLAEVASVTPLLAIPCSCKVLIQTAASTHHSIKTHLDFRPDLVLSTEACLAWYGNQVSCKTAISCSVDCISALQVGVRLHAG